VGQPWQWNGQKPISLFIFFSSISILSTTAPSPPIPHGHPGCTLFPLVGICWSGSPTCSKAGTIGNDDTNAGGYGRADGNGGGAILHLIFMLYMRHCYMWLDLMTFFWPGLQNYDKDYVCFNLHIF
jgi:hypothetical protein